MLEQQMQELRDLPKRVAGVESQILQLREEMQGGFSAIQSELRGEMYGIRDELRAEIRAGNVETRNFMRALYEDALTRIATMGEGQKGGDR